MVVHGDQCLMVFIIFLLLTSTFASHVAPQLFSFRSHFLQQCANSNCTVVEFKVPSITLSVLSVVLESPHFESQHRQLMQSHDRYFVVLNMTVKSEDLLPAYKDIDQFISVRPWWIIRQYPREHVHGVLGVDVLPQMILERVPSVVESLGRLVLERHFPSAEECAKRIKYLKTTAGSWGNDIIVNQRVFFESFPGAIHQLYMTSSGSPTDHIGYIEPSHCPNVIDKHQCAFLVISNCSIPSSLTSCHSSDCIKEGIYAPSTKSPGDHDFRSEGNDELQVEFRKVYPDVIPQGIPKSPAYRMIDPTGFAVANNSQMNNDFEQIMNYHTHHWMFNVLYKPNYLLGLQIQDVLQELYTPAVHVTLSSRNASSHLRGGATNGAHHGHHVAHDLSQAVSNYAHVHFERSIGVDTRCIAAHIRMGDRHLNNTDMKAWCVDHTNEGKEGDERAKGQWIDGAKLDMAQWHDMGCNWRQPFGSVRFDQIVDASQHLNPDIHDILVMTDDYHWVHRYVAHSF